MPNYRKQVVWWGKKVVLAWGGNIIIEILNFDESTVNVEWNFIRQC